MAATQSEKNNTEETFGDHLEILRKHLIRIVIAILAMSVVAFFYKEIIFDFILFAPKEQDFFTNRLLCEFSASFLNSDVLCINNNTYILQNIELHGQFRSHIWISFISGFILSFPYIIWELWWFIKPALNKHEINNSKGILFFTAIMFSIGVLFGYYIIAPLTINFLSSYEVSQLLENQFTFQSLISTIVNVTLASGAVFELPVLVYFLSKLGIVTPWTMKKYRKHSIVAIFVLSGIITPPDVFSQLLVCLPLYLLYEGSIKISSYVYNKQLKAYQQMSIA